MQQWAVQNRYNVQWYWHLQYPDLCYLQPGWIFVLVLEWRIQKWKCVHRYWHLRHTNMQCLHWWIVVRLRQWQSPYW